MGVGDRVHHRATGKWGDVQQVAYPYAWVLFDDAMRADLMYVDDLEAE